MIKEKQDIYKISKDIQRLDNYGALFKLVGVASCVAEVSYHQNIDQINPYILMASAGAFYLGTIFKDSAKGKRNNLPILSLSESEETLEEKL